MPSPSIPPPPSASIKEGQDWLRDHEGERCPVCTKKHLVSRRKINSGMAYALIVMYRTSGTEWMHKPTVLKGVGAEARDESLLRFWGLIEESLEKREDGGRSGWWRVTGPGCQFVMGRVRLPKYARFYDKKCLGLDTGETADIRDALSTAFSYDDLMRGI